MINAHIASATVFDGERDHYPSRVNRLLFHRQSDLRSTGAVVQPRDAR